MCRKAVISASFVLMLIVSADVAKAALTEGLVGYWPLDGNAEDTSGNGNNGVIMGNVTNTTDRFGTPDSAMNFPGSTSAYIDLGQPPSLLIKGSMTVAAWVRADTLNQTGRVIAKQGPGTARSWSIQLEVEGHARFDVGINPTDRIRADSEVLSFGPDEWWHLAGVFRPGQAVELYINGELAKSEPTTVTTQWIENGLPLNIGRRPQPGTPWQGDIDEVQMYNVGLAPGEIAGIVRGTLLAFPKARGPIPADGALHPSTWVNLSWKPGDLAVSHNVYLGDNFDDVNDGLGDTFRGNQTATFIVAGFPGFPYPDGLVPGTTYYWRIDEVNDADPNSPWKGDVWSFIIPPRKAYDPTPPDGARFVDPDVILSWTAGMDAKLHYVYFSDSFVDVNDGVAGLPHGATTYDPGPLARDTTYYWRVDENDGTATHKGDVWSFKIQPEITITDPNLVCWWTLDEGYGTTALDWSGHGNQGTLFGPTWTVPGLLGDAALDFSRGGYVAIQNLRYNSTGKTGVTVCAWIRTNSGSDQYIASFDRNEYFRLEINGSGGGPGQVGWDVMTSSGQVDSGSVTRIYDGLWHHVCGVFDSGTLIIYIDGEPEPSAMGGPTFGSGNTRFGFIGANSEATSFNGTQGTGSPVSGEIDDLRIYDKSLTAEEVRLAMRGDITLAWNPSPANGSTPYIRDVLPLSWSPGDKASGHDVYFGTDFDTVSDADASDTDGIYRGRQSTTIYNPPEGVEWGGGPYYWRVDEYNTDGTTSKGTVWTFTVADFIKIEDFEDYNDFEPDRIFDTWTDGWGVATNGSEVGYADPNFTLGEHHVETTIVHGGFQSLPYFFDNNFKYSEASLPLVSARNWTEEGVAVLSLWFYGDPNNAAEQMYVSISNTNGVTGTVYHDNLAAAQIATWTQWTIELQKFADQGVNLTNVDKLYIGFGNKSNLQAGGSGKMYFDDICLKRPAP